MRRVELNADGNAVVRILASKGLLATTATDKLWELLDECKLAVFKVIADRNMGKAYFVMMDSLMIFGEDGAATFSMITFCF